MAHEKLLRLLNFVWLLLVLPAVVAVLVGFLSHSVSLGIKTFLLVEFGVAILSPLLTAIAGAGTPRNATGKIASCNRRRCTGITKRRIALRWRRA